MNKKLILLASIIAFSVAGAAFAAVENIKVSGNYTAYGFSRNQYDLGVTNNFGSPDDNISGMASVTKLRFDADLTEDVMVTFGITDERIWGGAGELYTGPAFVTVKDFLLKVQT